MSRRPVAADDLYEHRIPSDVQIRSDGSLVVWVERRADRETGKVWTTLWSAWRDRPPRQLTFGRRRDRAPRISPDGQTIAFLRGGAERGEATQLCLLPIDGGEARTVIERRGDLSAPVWSPDGGRLAMSFRAADSVADGDDAPLSIRVDRLCYKMDGEGYLPQDRHRIYVVDPWAEAPEMQPVTTAGDWDDRDPAWSPDGTQLAFLTNRRPDRDIDIDNADLYRLDLATGEERPCTRERGLRMSPVWSPDGRWIAVVSCPSPRGHALFLRNVSVHRADPNGERPEQCLVPGLDRCSMHLTIDDLWGLDNWAPRPAFRADGRSLIAPVSDRGTTWLAEIALTSAGEPTGEIRRLFDDRVVIGYALAAGTDELAIITSSPTDPAHIDVLARDGSSRRPVARPFSEYLGQVAVREPIELEVAGPGGGNLQAWLVLPEGDGPFPLLLSIHGGPVVQFGRSYLHEMQVLCASGFAVLYANPRGSHGYGETFVSAIHGNWCDPAMADLLAVVDAAIARHPIDRERLGVLGGSYGGYMTNMLMAQTKRFRAGCTERCVSSMEAMIWCDTGGLLADELGALPWDDPALYARLSPLTYAASIEAPLLILHGLGDQRTPPDQGERLYVTLRLMGKPVEMVLFPGATHDLSRNGPPRQRVERLGVIVDWFRHHI